MYQIDEVNSFFVTIGINQNTGNRIDSKKQPVESDDKRNIFRLLDTSAAQAIANFLSRDGIVLVIFLFLITLYGSINYTNRCRDVCK